MNRPHRLRRAALCALLAAIATTSVARTARAEAIVDGNKVTFRLDARQWGDKPKQVTVAGSFQGWNKDASPMADADGDQIWELTLTIPDEAPHQYKFVIDGGRYITDPSGDTALEVDDNYGGKNSGFVMGFNPAKAPPAKPDHVNAEALKHDPQDVRDADAFEGKLRLRVRAQPADVQSASAVVDGKRYPLARMGLDFGLESFAGVVPASPGATYTFELKDGTATATLGAGGLANNGSAAGFAVPRPIIKTPAWSKSAIWYQIFPERFRNGDPSNDPGGKPGERLIDWKAQWFKAQPGEAPGDANFYEGAGNVWNRRYGGDIQGLRAALPYLREVGVNAIYLNPVFEAESMHKYDATDFRHIDDNFGVKGDLAKLTGETDDPATWQWTDSDKLFLEFVAEAHRQGFKVILDGVFNHTGRAHPFFQDVLEKGKNSRYAEWFEITDFGDPKNWRKLDDPYAVHGKPGGIQWKAWDKENGHLPVFRKDDKLGLAKGPRDHIMAITKRWLAPDGLPERGVDGWRLDVAPDIPHPFWRDWRKLVKETKPDAYITGEIWPWAQAWLNKGDQFDAVMNYQWAMPAQEFFVNEQKQMKPSVFAARLSQLQMAYPQEVVVAQQNLFDSHDTDRLASMFVNPDRPYDGANRPQDNAKDRPYSDAKPTPQQWERVKQAIAGQFGYVGAPMLYYGTEAGMWGPDDPSNRQPMIWRDLLPYADKRIEFNADLFAHVQRLTALRAQLPELRDGFYAPLSFDDERNVLVFRRGQGADAVYIAINRSNVATRIDVPIDDADATGPLVNWMDDRQARLIAPDTKSSPTARPRVEATGQGGIVASGGAARVDVPAFGTAILTVSKKNVAGR